MMKKVIGFLLLSLLVTTAVSKEKIVPAGTYSNLLRNSKLETLVDNSPGPWRNSEGRCTFIPESSPDGGGVFKIEKGKSIVVIRQDWTFSLTEKMLYRLTAKVRTSADFKAGEAKILIFNNGWTKTAPMSIKADKNTEWRTISAIVAAPSSPGGLYSVAILTRNVTSGTLEVANITLEPATIASYEAQIAWLKGVPFRKLHIFGIHKGILPAENKSISGRWYGNVPQNMEFAFDQQKFTPLKINRNGIFILPVKNLKPGNHLLKIQIDGKKFEYPFLIQKYPNRKIKALNNLNVQIAEINLKPGQKDTFVLDQEGPILFRTSSKEMKLHIDGAPKVLRSGNWLRLKAGPHTITASSAGTVAVHRIADTVYYQLGNGPYLTGLPKNNIAFARKNLMGAVTVFFNPAIPASYIAKEIHPSGAIALAMCAMADYKKFDPASPSVKLYDGIGVDEYSASSPKPLVEHFVRRKNFKSHTKKIWPWIAGSLQKNEIQAEILAALCDDGDILLYEAYMKSNLNDEEKARDFMLGRFKQTIATAEQLHPGFHRNLAIVTSHGNVPLSFTTDNNPAVDYKYFLDMQFNIWANDPAFRNLAAVGSWGGSYADRECNAWIAALFRHYVMEGKTTMLSQKYGYTFHPGIIKNCAFADGLNGWNTKGSVTPGISEGYCSVLERFGANPVDAETCAVMEKNSVLSQELKNLKKGQVYRIRIMTTGEVPVISLTGVQELAEKKIVFFSRKKPGEKGTDIYFRANQTTGKITLTAKNGKSTVHYLSATPSFEYNELSEAEKKESVRELARKLKEFLIRKNVPNGPGNWFENLKGTPVNGLSGKMTHNGTALKIVFQSPAEESGIWEIHSALNPAKGDLLILSVDKHGKVNAQSVVRVGGGMPTKQITSLGNIASATVSSARGIRTITLTIPFKNVAKYGISPGKESRMNFFYVTEKKVAGWNPTFKSERRLPWRLGRVYFE